MADENSSGSGLLTLATVVLSLSWIVAGLATAVLLLLLTQPLGIPECTSYDLDGQRAGQVGTIATGAGMAAVWGIALASLWRRGRTPRARLLLAVALPAAILLVFIAGGAATGAAVDAVAPNTDHAMCW